MKCIITILSLVMLFVLDVYARPDSSRQEQDDSTHDVILKIIQKGESADQCRLNGKYNDAYRHYREIISMAERCGKPGEVYRDDARTKVGEMFYSLAISQDKSGAHDEALKSLDIAVKYGYKRAITLHARWCNSSIHTNDHTNVVDAKIGYSPDVPKHGTVRRIYIGDSIDSLEKKKEKKYIEFVRCDPDNDGDGFWISRYELYMDNLATSFLGETPFHLFQGRGDSFRSIANLNYCALNLLLEQLNAQVSGTFYVPTSKQWYEAAEQMPLNERIYSSDIYDYAWCQENSNGEVHERGGKKPNGIGLYDVWGNVGEWCRVAEGGHDLLRPDELVAMGGDFKSPHDILRGKNSFVHDGFAGVRLCYSDLKCNGPRRTLRVFIDNKLAVEKIRIAANKLGITFNDSPHIWPWALDIDLVSEKSLVSKSDIVHLYNNLKSVIDDLYAARKLCTWTLGTGRMPDDDIYRTIYFQCEAITYSSRFWSDILNGIDTRQCYLGKGMKGTLDFSQQRSTSKYLINSLNSLNYLMRELNKPVTHGDGRQDQNKTMSKTNVIEVADWYQKHKAALVVIKGGKMVGSGFMARDHRTNELYLYTNRHVVDGQKKIVVEAIGGENVYVNSLEYAEGYDLARCRVVNKSKFINSALKMTMDIPALDEPIFTIGNSDGLGVQSLLKGKVIGVTPKQDIVEISAQIVHGNSGGPVINNSGSVFSVASFAISDDDKTDKVKSGTRFSEARRFAICLSAVKSWKKIR